MSQVVAGAKEILARHPVIDVVVENAGLVGPTTPPTTKDGFVLSMQVNHFAPALLSDLLLPGLQRAGASGVPGRVVNVGSGNAYDVLSPDFPRHESLEDIMRWSRNSSSGLSAINYYSLSKFLQIHHAREFSRRNGPGVIAFSVNPGFFRNLSAPLPPSIREVCDTVVLFRPCPMTDAQGATGIVFAALMPGIEGGGGALFDYETAFEKTGPPYWKQQGPSCVPRPLPFWSEANASAWF